MTDSTAPPPPPPRTEAEDAKENGGPEEEEEEDAPMPPAPSASTAAAAPPATVAAVAVAAPAQTGGGKRSPSDFLKTVLGRPVVVKLNSGIDYRGERLGTSTLLLMMCQRHERGRKGSLAVSRRWTILRTGSVVRIGGGRSFPVGSALVSLVCGSVHNQSFCGASGCPRGASKVVLDTSRVFPCNTRF